MIGFIGCGAMGSSIARGVLKAGLAAPHEIIVSDAHKHASIRIADELGVRVAATNAELVETVGYTHQHEHSPHNVVILAVKPAMVSTVLADICVPAAHTGTVIASIAAGTPISALEAALQPGQPVVRIMPNVAAQIGAGMSALCAGSATTPEQLAAVRTIFNAVGQTVELAEKDFSAFTAIAGSSPAWTFQYIDSLSRGALDAGMTKDASLRAAAQAVLGAAQLALNSLERGVRPQALIDTVTSPGGTTVAGLIAADNAGFSNATIAAVTACVARERELGQ